MSSNLWYLRLLDTSDPKAATKVVKELYFRLYIDAQRYVADHFRKLIEAHDDLIALADIDDKAKQLDYSIDKDGIFIPFVRKEYKHDLPVLQQLMARLGIKQNYVIDLKSIRG